MSVSYTIPKVLTLQSNDEYVFEPDPYARYNIKLYLYAETLDNTVTFYDSQGNAQDPVVVTSGLEIIAKNANYRKVTFADQNNYNIYMVLSKAVYSSDTDLTCLPPSVDLSIAPLSINVNISSQTISQLNVNVATWTAGTLAVNISAQSVGNLAVNLAAITTSANLNVNLAAQSANINVALAASSVTLDINLSSITSGVTLDVSVQNASLTVVVSGTADVNISSTTGNIPVSIAASSATVTVSVSGTADVNISSQSGNLNVNLAASAITLSVDVTNSSLTVSVSNSNIDVTIQNSVLDVQGDVAITIGTTTYQSIPISIVAQQVGNLTVDISAQSVGNLGVSVAAWSAGTIDVNLAANNAGNITVNLAAISATTNLNVNLAASSATVTVSVSGTVDVNITNASITISGSVSISGTPNVNISSSSITLNVNSLVTAGTLTTIGSSNAQLSTTNTAETSLVDNNYEVWASNIASVSVSFNAHVSGGTGTIKVYFNGELLLDQSVNETSSTAFSTPVIDYATYSAMRLGMSTDTLKITAIAPSGQTIYLDSWSFQGAEGSAMLVSLNAIATTANLNVNLAAQSANINVALAASSVTLDVNISSQSANLNVNLAASGITLDVSVQNASLTVVVSGTAQVNIASTTGNIPVSIAASSATVTVSVSGTADVNISSQSGNLNVNLAASAVTLDINLSSITSGVTLDVSVQNATLTVVVSGTADVNISSTTGNIPVSIQASSISLNVDIGNVPSVNPNFETTLTSALTNGNAYTSLSVNATPTPLLSGQSLTLVSGTNTQVVTVSQTVPAGSTSIPVTSFNANFAYPIGTSVIGSLNATILNSQLNVNVAAQTVGNLAVNIAAQSVGNLNVNLAAQTVGNIAVNLAANSAGNITVNLAAISATTNLNVNLAASSATVTVSVSGTADVNISSTTGNIPVSIAASSATVTVSVSGTAQVNIASTTGNIPVSIAASSATVTVSVSGTADVNISSTTGNIPVSIQASSISLNVDIGNVPSVNPNFETTLTSALTNGNAYTSLSVNATPTPLLSGQSLTLVSGTNTQVVTVSQTVPAGSTSIPVSSFDANYAYPVGASLIGSLNATIINSILNVNVSSQTANLNVNLAASAVTLDINLSSVTAGVTLDVSVQNASLTVVVSGTADVNISSQSGNLNVNLAASAITLDVAVSGTAQVNITNATISITTLQLPSSLTGGGNLSVGLFEDATITAVNPLGNPMLNSKLVGTPSGLTAAGLLIDYWKLVSLPASATVSADSTPPAVPAGSGIALNAGNAFKASSGGTSGDCEVYQMLNQDGTDSFGDGGSFKQGVQPGVVYNIGFWFYLNSASDSVTLKLHQYDAAMNPLGSSVSFSAPSTVGAWTAFSDSWTCPAGTYNVDFELVLGVSSTSGDYCEAYNPSMDISIANVGTRPYIPLAMTFDGQVIPPGTVQLVNNGTTTTTVTFENGSTQVIYPGLSASFNSGGGATVSGGSGTVSTSSTGRYQIVP